MQATGLICEYNPFHNGHLYHLNKVKELYKENIIIAVVSSHFMQRGEVSILNKWDKATLALTMGVDLIIELPFPFATQSADIFARGSIEILDTLGVQNIVFGSETDDIEKLEKYVDTQLHNKEYDKLVQKFLKEGYNYPTALSKALSFFHIDKMDTPNDLLALSYIKAIKEQGSSIRPISILRKGEHHNKELSPLCSGSAIRKAIKNGENVEKSCPKETQKYLEHPLFIEDYFPYLKYKILTEINDLQKYQGVEEDLQKRIQETIIDCNSLEELIHKIKTKKYTYNRISRMFTHILCHFTKEEAKNMKEIEYIRVLGFSSKGRRYLNQIKKEVKIPIITHFGDSKSPMLKMEQRATYVYASLLPDKEKLELIEAEYKNKPIIF